MGIIVKRTAVQGKIPTTAQIVTGEIQMNTIDGRVFAGRNSGTPSVVQLNTVAQMFSSSWQPIAGVGPTDSFEFNDHVFLFSQGAAQTCVMYVRIPSAYLTGTQINMKLAQYSPGTSNVVKLQAVTYLIRKNTDAISSTNNSYTSSNGDAALSATANLYSEVVYDLTSTIGTINSVAVNPGDMLLVQLTRVTPSGTEDTNDLRMLTGATEIVFS